MDNPAPNFERRSLVATKWGCLVMAVSGVGAAWLSRSDALMLDGLFSALGFVSSIIAIKVSVSVERAPDRRRPFGYAANQPIFIAFRALVLLGVILFAGLTAIEKILLYLGGEEIEALILGPVLVYMIAMAIIGFALAAYHKLNLKRDGTNSSLLRAEYVGAMMDGAISIAAGIALLGAPFLNGTFLEGLVPVSDSIVVLALLVFFTPEPIRILRSAIGEVSGEAPPQEELSNLKRFVEQTFAESPLTVLEVTMQVLGRQSAVIAYVRPDVPLTGEAVDELRDLLTDACHKEIGPGYAEILIGARPAFELPE